MQSLPNFVQSLPKFMQCLPSGHKYLYYTLLKSNNSSKFTDSAKLIGLSNLVCELIRENDETGLSQDKQFFLLELIINIKQLDTPKAKNLFTLLTRICPTIFKEGIETREKTEKIRQQELEKEKKIKEQEAKCRQCMKTGEYADAIRYNELLPEEIRTEIYQDFEKVYTEFVMHFEFKKAFNLACLLPKRLQTKFLDPLLSTSIFLGEYLMAAKICKQLEYPKLIIPNVDADKMEKAISTAVFERAEELSLLKPYQNDDVFNLLTKLYNEIFSHSAEEKKMLVSRMLTAAQLFPKNSIALLGMVSQVTVSIEDLDYEKFIFKRILDIQAETLFVENVYSMKTLDFKIVDKFIFALPPYLKRPYARAFVNNFFEERFYQFQQMYETIKEQIDEDTEDTLLSNIYGMACFFMYFPNAETKNYANLLSPYVEKLVSFSARRGSYFTAVLLAFRVAKTSEEQLGLFLIILSASQSNNKPVPKETQSIIDGAIKHLSEGGNLVIDDMS